MAKKGVFSKGVVIGIIVLFIGIAVQPSIAIIPIDDEVDVDAKEYLFQTIIDIANKPEVREFLKQNSHNMFVSDFDFKGLYSKLLVKNPRLLTRLLVTRPSISHGYLDKIYNKGSNMINILGKERVYEVMDTIMDSNTEFYDGLSNIILNDEELSDRIDTLIEINSKLFRPLCYILGIMLNLLTYLEIILFVVIFEFWYHPFMSLLAIIPFVISFTISYIIVNIMDILQCPIL